MSLRAATADMALRSARASQSVQFSLDEHCFLRACSASEISPAEASGIITAARRLIIELMQEGDSSASSGASATT
jgi:hypothetical protein